MVSSRVVAVILGFASALLAAPAAAVERTNVDLQLVLAVNSSGSVDAREFRLQMQGFAAAFRSPAVHHAIAQGTLGAIAVTMFEWSSFELQRLSIPWTMVGDAESLTVLADTLDKAARRVPGGSTSISGALAFAKTLFDQSFQSERKVVDVSGDGSNNNGPAVTTMRDRLVDAAITINGLTIVNDEPNLREYYEQNVIGGVGSFVMVAEDYNSFANAILSKLLTEIAAAPAPIRHAVLAP